MAKKAAKALLEVTLPYLEARQGQRTLLLTSMPASVLVKISYVAVRREDKEEGAVQRPLSERRIGSIRDFALAGGDFPACVILNWMRPELLTVNKNKTLRIRVADRAAQIIDGQHRTIGLEEAIFDRKAVGKMDIPVAIYRQLSTKECADIFLSINTEQKPVPKSLAYDLFGIASEHLVDPAAVRAADIAQSLNDDPDSPYRGLVKYTGEAKPRGPKSKLGIPLSTVVNALKPLVAEKGGFEGVGVRELVKQTKVVTTFFTVLADWYGEEWENRNNAFMHAVGFTGAIDFLKNHLIPYCNGKRSYAIGTIRGAMELDGDNLIFRQEVARMQGRAAATKITELLKERFTPAEEQEAEIEY
ncbi:MAG: DGQHR domain-containing protein [Planctomycetaceae bacterium]